MDGFYITDGDNGMDYYTGSELPFYYRSFDASTPTGSGHDTNGAAAPPRDGLDTISDLYDLFDFDTRDR